MPRTNQRPTLSHPEPHVALPNRTRSSARSDSWEIRLPPSWRECAMTRTTRQRARSDPRGHGQRVRARSLAAPTDSIPKSAVMLLRDAESSRVCAQVCAAEAESVREWGCQRAGSGTEDARRPRGKRHAESPWLRLMVGAGVPNHHEFEPAGWVDPRNGLAPTSDSGPRPEGDRPEREPEPALRHLPCDGGRKIFAA